MNRIKFIHNILLTLVMILLMDPRSFYGLGFHEWAGLIIGLFFILNKAFNWGWIKKVTVCFFRSTPGRARLNYVLEHNHFNGSHCDYRRTRLCKPSLPGK